MLNLSSINFAEVMAAIESSTRPVSILWQTDDSIAFVARGRVGRSEFHVDPSDEVMYMVKGDMALHYRTPEGEEKILPLREGEIMHCPAGTPHSPRFAPDAFVLVMERKRRPEERDRFLWFCPGCGGSLYETARHVTDYREDPVSRVYEEFYGSETNRTCKQCGHIASRPG
ncbi:MAG TPA: 3-hydroxybutyryl-CoA dehydratase [Methylomirabilota bacterium]|jgi:3-hydroxyanthranilate 3,4-dioxygenase